MSALIEHLAWATHASMTRTGLGRAVHTVLVDEGPCDDVALGWSPPPPAEPASAHPADVLELLLSDDEGGAGWLQVRPATALSQEEQRAVTRMLSLGQRTVRRIERVARVARHAHERAEAGRTHHGNLVTRSPAMRELADRLRAVAPHPTTVLLRGDSGTGKERLAEQLHRWSGRRGPFVAVNCGAIPDDLVESELFGHVAGAFTSAVKARKGRFALANGGTLFLDEVAELRPLAQVRLLRVLEEGSITPVGAEQKTPVDVRVVCATHRDLDAMVGQGTFREDLYFRLTPFELEVPSLVDRPEDFPELVASLVDGHARRLRRAPPRIPPDVVAALTRRTWPGNVRELSNFLERALILDGSDVIKLPDDGLRARRPKAAMSFDDASRAVILDALAMAGGRIYGEGGAAAALNLKPTTLQGKMRKLGIDRDAAASRDAP